MTRISRIADLERALCEDPDDPELPLVYADALGDERGEHIVLANLAAPTKEQRIRERELRRAAERAMWSGVERRGLARITWRAGFVDQLHCDLRDDDALARLAALLARPELLRLRVIDLRPGWYTRERELDEIVPLFAHLPIRWLGTGGPLDVEALRARLPRLEGGAGESAGAGGLCEVVTPERLVVNAPDLGVVDQIETRPLRDFAIFNGNDAFNDRFIDRLVKSPLLPRLRSLGFSVHRFDSSNKRLLAQRDAFAHVKFFTVPSWGDGWTAAWHNLAHLYEALGRYDEALTEFDALVTIDDDPAYWADIGMQLAKLERRNEALAAHDRAIELDPKAQRAWSGRACVLEDLERFGEALAAWDAGIAAGLSDVHTWSHRAWTLMRLGRDGEALVDLDKALAIEPAHEWSLEEKQRLTSFVAKTKRGLRKLFAR